MNARKEPNIPPSTSPLAPPVLTPKLDRLRVGQNSQDQDQGQDEDQDQGQRAGRQPSRPGRTRGGRKPPPAAADAIPTTIRFDPEESSAIDRFVLELRDYAGRRALDKAEVFRELIRMGMEHEPTRKALLRRIR
ncbi:MAG TPA: hypothetical protein VN520_14230 [Streptomyces sp.]|uniref:hypothetical protein n=1 Tax=Streptomyces sp. TaxID=1931 RepID=UPI002C23EF9B|nr:hypothetical protein [Streptomyces sp.]HWU07515.1 hypothetical protein [Streptomyces sp.]